MSSGTGNGMPQNEIWDEIHPQHPATSVVMVADNGHVAEIIDSLKWEIKHQDPTTFSEFYIIHTADFSEENKEKVISLQAECKNCAIYLIDMGQSLFYSDSRPI